MSETDSLKVIIKSIGYLSSYELLLEYLGGIYTLLKIKLKTQYGRTHLVEIRYIYGLEIQLY